MRRVLPALSQIYEVLKLVGDATCGEATERQSKYGIDPSSIDQVESLLRWSDYRPGTTEDAFVLLDVPQLAQRALLFARSALSQFSRSQSDREQSLGQPLSTGTKVQQLSKARLELDLIRDEADTTLILYIYTHKLHTLFDITYSRDRGLSSLIPVFNSLPQLWPTLKGTSDVPDNMVVPLLEALEFWCKALSGVSKTNMRTFSARLLSFPNMALGPPRGHSFSDVNVGGQSQVHLGDVHHHHFVLNTAGTESHVKNGTSPLVVLDTLLESLRARLISQLGFHEVTSRQEMVSESHSGTFDWVFKPPVAHAAGLQAFSAWWSNQHQRENIFWVSGRAGSGKSTLIKHLSSIKQAAPSPFGASRSAADVVLSHFFWAAGTPLQKSISGCLRSLLSQIPMQYGTSISTIIPKSILLSAIDNSKSDQTSRWLTDVGFLERLLFTLVISVCQKATAVIFIDGLDECADSDEDVASFLGYLKRLSQTPNVKLCLSSRPENLFLEELDEYHSVRLEDLNRPDIFKYAHDKLSQSKQIGRMNVHELQPARQIAETVAKKSSGVFLWVYLVVRDLLAGARDGDDYRTLLLTLEEMPPELDEYFHRMLRKVKARYREASSALFQVMINRRKVAIPVTLQGLNLLDLEVFTGKADFVFDRNVNFEPLSLGSVLQSRLDLAQRFVNSRSMGLLEFQWNEENPYGTTNFLHRTVIEFLETSQAQNILHQHTKGPFDCRLYQAMRLVGRLRRCAAMNGVDPEREPRAPNAEIWLHELCREMHRGVLAEPDLLRRTCEILRESFGLIAQDVYNCRIDTQEFLSPSKTLSEDCQNIIILGNTVLFIEVGFSLAIYLEGCMIGDELTMIDTLFIRHTGYNMDEDRFTILKSLLVSGLDPNIKGCDGSSSWLRILLFPYRMDLLTHEPFDQIRQRYAELVILMLQSGAALRFSRDCIDSTRRDRLGLYTRGFLWVSKVQHKIEDDTSYRISDILCRCTNFTTTNKRTIAGIIRKRELQEYGSVSMRVENAISHWELYDNATTQDRRWQISDLQPFTDGFVILGQKLKWAYDRQEWEVWSK